MPLSQTAGQPSKGVSEKQSSARGKLSTDSSNDKNSTDTETLKAILAAITKDQQERTANQNQEGAKENESIKAEWWLVGIGIAQTLALIGTLIFIGLQAREMANATRAMRDSTAEVKRQADLQQSAMQQWIDISDWNSGIHADGKHLIIRFTISNPTNFPIIIKKSWIIFGSNRLKYSLGEDRRLTPKNFIPVRIEMPITGEELDRLTTNNPIVIGIQGGLRHTDMGPNEETIMPIIGNLICDRLGCRFDPESINPIQALDEDWENCY